MEDSSGEDSLSWGGAVALVLGNITMRSLRWGQRDPERDTKHSGQKK